MNQHTEPSMAEKMTEDPGGTADATTGGEDMVAWSTLTEAMEAVGTTTGTRTTTGHETTAPTTGTPEAGGTPGDRSKTGKPAGATAEDTAGAPITAIRMPAEVATAAWNPEVG